MSVGVGAGSGAGALRVAVAGASGRMGRMLIEALLDAPDAALAGALDMAGSPALGQDAGAALGRTSGRPGELIRPNPPSAGEAAAPGLMSTNS